VCDLMCTSQVYHFHTNWKYICNVYSQVASICRSFTQSAARERPDLNKYHPHTQAGISGDHIFLNSVLKVRHEPKLFHFSPWKTTRTGSGFIMEGER
jgi:hypothetical protein